MAQIMFETCNVPAIYTVLHTALTPFAYVRTTDIVMDLATVRDYAKLKIEEDKNKDLGLKSSNHNRKRAPATLLP